MPCHVTQPTGGCGVLCHVMHPKGGVVCCAVQPTGVCVVQLIRFTTLMCIENTHPHKVH